MVWKKLHKNLQKARAVWKVKDRRAVGRKDREADNHVDLTTRMKISHSEGDVTIAGWWLQNSALSSFEQGKLYHAHSVVT